MKWLKWKYIVMLELSHSIYFRCSKLVSDKVLYHWSKFIVMISFLETKESRHFPLKCKFNDFIMRTKAFKKILLNKFTKVLYKLSSYKFQRIIYVSTDRSYVYIYFDMIEDLFDQINLAKCYFMFNSNH